MSKLTEIITEYRRLGISDQIDYDKIYLYSIITHSTAVEGSTVTEVENRLMFDDGISPNKPLVEQLMNIDLKNAYVEALALAAQHTDYSVRLLCHLSSMVMKNTGSEYNTMAGKFNSAEGDLRLLNVTAGRGGKSYISFKKVPQRLEDFCNWLNLKRKEVSAGKIEKIYELSFMAHYNLVYIHPWADGNGRMARLMMNHLQFEFGLIPAKVLKEDKGEYINALIATRENEDIHYFVDFMTEEMVKTVSSDIDAFLKSTEESGEKKPENREKKQKSREKILTLLKQDPSFTTRKLAEAIGITPKAIEKQLSKLKAEGLIERVGPDKGGKWKVL